MGKKLKNVNGTVDVNVLAKNLIGDDFETVDFRNKMFKELYGKT